MGKPGEVNSGNFNFRYGLVDGISIDAYERYGGIFGRSMFGIEGGFYLNFNSTESDSDSDLDSDSEDVSRKSMNYLSVQPLDLFLDVSFDGDRKTSEEVKNGLKLSGGFMENAPSFGKSFPSLGVGVDLYLQSEPKREDDAKFFGNFSVKLGVLGGIDVASEAGYESYDTVYDGVTLFSIAAGVGLKNENVKLGFNAVYGHLAKEDGYEGNWYENFYTPDVYENYFGFSPNLRVTVKPINLSIAYYYLNCSGGDHFGEDENYILSIEDDSVADTNHRFTADISVKVFEDEEFFIAPGLKGNYYSGSREENYDYHIASGGLTISDGPLDPGFNDFGQNKTYIYPYFRTGIDDVKAEVGVGYSKKNKSYDTNCADICDTGDSGDEGAFDAYIKAEFSW